MRRPVLFVGLAAAALGVVSVADVEPFTTFGATPAASTSSTNGQGPPSGPDPVLCEVTGVRTSYNSTYDQTSGRYLIQQVTVSDLDSACDGATLGVQLRDGSAVVGSGSGTVGASSTMQVAMTPPAPAEAVVAVHVALRGGTVPLPAECAGFRADRRAYGTVGNDALVGTSLSDLMYGLGGNDNVRSGPNGDCVDGGAGHDTLDGESGDDVVIGGDGNDKLSGGNGRDKLHGGSGNDVLNGGTGTDECISGGGTDTFVGCEVQR